MLNGNRIDTILRWWEDFWYLAGTLKKIGLVVAGKGEILRVKNGPPSSSSFSPQKCWWEFRKYLLEQSKSPSSADRYCNQRFVSLDTKWDILDAVDTVAHSILAWCVGSKRIFAPDQDLHLLLAATSLGSTTWSDVKMPFECFGIQLAEPIELGNKPYDFIIVRNHEFMFRKQKTEGVYQEAATTTEPCVSISLFPSATYRPITQGERIRLDGAVKRGDDDQAIRIHKQAFLNCLGLSPSILNMWGHLGSKVKDVLPIKSNVLVKPNSPPVSDEAMSVMSRMLRVVAGLCLYLQTLPNASPRLRKVTTPRYQGSRQDVTSGQEVLLVTVENALDDSSRRILRNPANETDEKGGSERTSPHYRRGFFHRPKGKGDDPSCQKTKWTRPTIVRQDLLEKGILPKGSQTTIANLA